MTTLSHEAPKDAERRGWIDLPVLWVSLAIAVIWVAVLFAAVYGPDMTFMNGSGTEVTTIPSGVGVALFAFLASSAVAKHGFGRHDRFA